MSRCSHFLTLACATLFLTGSANAQDNKARTDDPKATTDTQSVIVSPVENDRRIARWIILDVQGIVDCSKEAVDRTTNETIKQFAQTMLTEHKDCISKLEQLSSRDGTVNKVEKNAPIARLEDAKVDPARAGILTKDEGGQLRDRKLVYRPTDFVEVKKDVCEKLKAVMMKEMKQIPANEFDAMYMKHMVVAHEAVLASCQATRSTASSELQAHLDQNIEKLNAHLNKARELCKQVSVGASAKR